LRRPTGRDIQGRSDGGYIGRQKTSIAVVWHNTKAYKYVNLSFAFAFAAE